MTSQLTTDLAGPLTTSTGPDHVPFPSAQLLELIRADADAADRRASLGQASFERMRSEGLFHLLVPPELGGAGGTPRQWFDATLAVTGLASPARIRSSNRPARAPVSKKSTCG